jgi:hypothetical protein
LVVTTRWENEGAVQLTEIELLTGDPRATFGWLASELHSKTFPIELLANPLPVNVTAWPFTKPVDGVAVKVTAANADIVVPISTAPPTTRIEAATMRNLARTSRPSERSVVTLDRPDDLFTVDPLVARIRRSLMNQFVAAALQQFALSTTGYGSPVLDRILIFDEVGAAHSGLPPGTCWTRHTPRIAGPTRRLPRALPTRDISRDADRDASASSNALPSRGGTSSIVGMRADRTLNILDKDEFRGAWTALLLTAASSRQRVGSVGVTSCPSMQ